MHYLLSSSSSPKIDGAIMQGCVSDREIMVQEISPSIYDSHCALAHSYVNEGRGDEILPFTVTKSTFMSAPVSAKRWLSLASPGPNHAGEDDYFSSDLPDERLQTTFGALGKTGVGLGFLYSGSDQYVPSTVDKVRLVERWHEHVSRGGGVIGEGSGIVKGASHTLKNGGQGLEDLVMRIIGSLERL